MVKVSVVKDGMASPLLLEARVSGERFGLGESLGVSTIPTLVLSGTGGASLTLT